MRGTSWWMQMGMALVATMSLAVSAVAGPVGAGAPLPDRGGETPGADLVALIVQAEDGSQGAARAVRAVGGSVSRRLPLVSGVAAEIPRSEVGRLRSTPGVFQVSSNEQIDFNETTSDPTLSPQRIPKVVKSTKLWSEGVTGQDVTVALIDTGIYADHPDLKGRVVHCEDFSHEADTAAHCADTFGHGTFMAGLIAGNGTASKGSFRGTAPKAKLVSVKLAGFDGATDVGHVLAGIQWVVAHKDTYKIRIMNLSLGTDSTQSYLLSPLNYAVQKAWKAGIVVIVSAGNDGSDSRTILKPADDPYVVTVGAAHDQNTTSVSDDVVPVFSSRGPTSADGLTKPDVVAPGVHTISLRSPGSAIDQAFGDTATVKGHYFRGTGTSMAAATTTGVAAQILQAQPKLVPDQVKYRLTSTARSIVTTDQYAAGAGEIDAYRAATSTSTTKANQGLFMGLGNGLGSLQNDRGSLQPSVVTPAGEMTLSGEYVPLYDDSLISLSNPLGLLAWEGATYTTTGWDPLSWALTSWVQSDWAAAKWKDGDWVATTYEAAKWKGTEWSNPDWEAAKWKDTDWNAAKWKATTWQSKWYAAAWD